MNHDLSHPQSPESPPETTRGSAPFLGDEPDPRSAHDEPRPAENALDDSHPEAGQGQPAETPDVAAAPDSVDGDIRWDIVQDDPANPFTSSLLFSEDGEPLLWWALDPVTVNSLIAALNAVKQAQVFALTGDTSAVDATPQRPSAQTEPTFDVEVAERQRTRQPRDKTGWPWWRRHKVATFFIAILALMFLVPFITLGGQM